MVMTFSIGITLQANPKTSLYLSLALPYLSWTFSNNTKVCNCRSNNSTKIVSIKRHSINFAIKSMLRTPETVKSFSYKKWRIKSNSSNTKTNYSKHKKNVNGVKDLSQECYTTTKKTHAFKLSIISITKISL